VKNWCLALVFVASVAGARLADAQVSGLNLDIYGTTGNNVTGVTRLVATVPGTAPAGVWVSFYVDGKWEATSTGAAPYEYAWDTSQATLGKHTVMVLLGDKTGSLINAQENVIVQ
jgi:hypothetical protein